jgi:hypothetical protein
MASRQAISSCTHSFVRASASPSRQRRERALRLRVEHRAGVLDALEQVEPLIVRKAGRIDVEQLVDHHVHASNVTDKV